MNTATRKPIAAIVLAAAMLAVAPVRVGAEPSATTSFHATYGGTFTITFLTGPALSDELRFNGSGFATPGGPSSVDGYSTLRPTLGSHGVCTRTEHDEVTLRLGGGELHLRNDAQDCIDLLSHPGRILIHGHGTWTVTGGTGSYAQATGTGTVDVSAEVTALGVGSVSGTFDRLDFAGELHRGG